jgi:hypothetical protein
MRKRRQKRRFQATRGGTATRGEAFGALDKLGVTGSSPVPPTSRKAPLLRGFRPYAALRVTLVERAS